MSKLNLITWSSIAFLGLLFISATTSLEKTILPWKNGILNGPFEINLKQGSKEKLEGNFKYNQKSGQWTLFDKKGKVIQKRSYDNNFEYTTLLANGKEYSSPELVRDSKGSYEYAAIIEKDISFSRRLWLTMNNDMIYSNPNFYRILSQMDLVKQKVYSNYELQEEVDPKVAKKSNFEEMDELQIMGDYFYDNKRKLSEFRVLALSPIMSDTSIQEVWYYYPDMRISFAQIQVESENPMIYNLDDVFFFGEYPHLIYKVENIQDTSFVKDHSLPSNTINELHNLLEVEAQMWQAK